MLREFIVILSKIATSFMLLEKSLQNGHKDVIVKELKQNRDELRSIKLLLKNRLENKNV